MKKFSFRLQRVLDLRTIQEKARLSELGRERSRLDAENEKLQVFAGEADDQITQMRMEQASPFRTWVRQTNHAYLGRVKRVVDFQRTVVNHQSEAVESAREKYVDAHRHTQSLEKFHDKRRSEWKAESVREEGKQLDEHAARRHISGGEG